MPLLISPIDGSPMRQIQRFGIEIDVCPTSGGIWLDKGELEKLMALLKSDAEEEAKFFAKNQDDHNRGVHVENYNRGNQSAPYGQPAPQYNQPKYDDDYYKKPEYSDRNYDPRYQNKYKKKSTMGRMMDIFDF